MRLIADAEAPEAAVEDLDIREELVGEKLPLRRATGNRPAAKKPQKAKKGVSSRPSPPSPSVDAAVVVADHLDPVTSVEDVEAADSTSTLKKTVATAKLR